MVLTGVSITDFVITAYVHLKRKDIIGGMYDRHTVYMVKGVSIKDCYSVRTVKSRVSFESNALQCTRGIWKVLSMAS